VSLAGWLQEARIKPAWGF